MKALLIITALLTSTAYAQSLSLGALKNLMEQKKSALENVVPGMSKRLVTLSSIQLENGESCNFKQVSDQSVLKVLDDKLLVFSLQKFMPANTATCLSNGFRPFAEKILFYDSKPSVDSEIAELQTAQGLSLTLSENILNIKVNEEEGEIVFLYDLSKPLFKNLVSTKAENLIINGEELPDVRPESVDLTQVLFCEMEDGEASDCAEGDYSDFLFD